MQGGVCVQGLTIEGHFCICLLKVESFFELIENPSLRGQAIKHVCDLTTSVKANPGSVCNLCRCDEET